MLLEGLTVGEDLTYQEYPVKIVDTFKKVTQNNRYKMCKVQWSNHTKSVTFEESFPICPNLKGEIHHKGGRFVTP
jgi:hypothetical protein